MDHATPSLPSRDFSVTEAFYQRLGFERTWRDAGWMILRRGSITLEFFLWPDLDPSLSSFGSCLRLDDLDGFYRQCLDADLLEKTLGLPRLHPPKVEAWGGRVGSLIDPDGSLLRLIQN